MGFKPVGDLGSLNDWKCSDIRYDVVNIFCQFHFIWMLPFSQLWGTNKVSQSWNRGYSKLTHIWWRSTRFNHNESTISVDIIVVTVWGFFYAIILILLLTISFNGLPCMHVHCFEWACITVQLLCTSHSSAMWCACLPCDVHVCCVMCVHAVSWPCTAVWWPCDDRVMTVHECGDHAMPV